MKRSARGFTLVELMVVVAVMAVLAALALPMLAEAQRKAKRTEALVVTTGWADAWTAYLVEFEGDVATVAGCTTRFSDPPGKSLHDWPAPLGGHCDEVGFRPDGQIRGAYDADPTNLRGYSDVDGDGQLQIVVMNMGPDGVFEFDDTASCSPYYYSCSVF